MRSATRTAFSAAIFSIGTLLAIDAIAKPQNARSRIYNEFHTDLFAKEPPLRSECPSWKDVVKGDTFDNKAFSAISKNGRPCFVNRVKYAHGIEDFSGNDAFGSNFAVYRTDKPNYYEVDLAVRFFIGKLSENREDKFNKFRSKISKCIKNNPIILTDSERFLKINVSLILKHKNKSKYEFYLKDGNYEDTDIDKNLFGIDLHDNFKRNNKENYSIKIPCATLFHELLHITGLHDLYDTKNKLTGKPEKYDAFIPKKNLSLRQLRKKHCSPKKRDINCFKMLLEKGEVEQKRFPLFDCRDPKDYQTTGTEIKIPNIMDSHKFFDLKNSDVSIKICKSSKTVKDDDTNIAQKQCDSGDQQLLSSKLSTMAQLDLIHKYAKLKFKLSNTEYYVTYDDRRELKSLPPSLTPEQFSMIIYTNNLDHPEVREFARVAKNTYRNRYEAGVYGGCRR